MVIAPSDTPAVDARLLQFSNVWHSFSDDPWILDVVTSGYYIDFPSTPFQFTMPKDIKLLSK